MTDTYADQARRTARIWLAAAAALGVVIIVLWLRDVQAPVPVLRIIFAVCCVASSYHSGRSRGWRAHE